MSGTEEEEDYMNASAIATENDDIPSSISPSHPSSLSPP